MKHYLYPELREKVFRAIYRQGVRLTWIERAYTKWENDFLPEPCIEEIKGKERGLATDCKCRGCMERNCFAMFERVVQHIR